MTSQPIIQHSFNAGEWAPALNARVDIAKYHSGAALLQNFFVDYRGGATARSGTKYILQCLDSSKAVRLIPFQASVLVSYMLEFGNQTLRFYNNGAPVLETAANITAITKANPGVLSVVNTYVNGDVIFISGILGMTQLNGNYYKVANRTAGTITLKDLNGVDINTSGYTTYISGGTTQRVYTIATPYLSTELAALKFVQNVNILILNHPNYGPYQLTLISATNWTLAAIIFGSTIAAPVGQAVATTLAAGTWNYAYVVTAVDVNGQESIPSAYAVLAATVDQRTVAGTNTVTWTAVTGAISYNVYKAEIRQTNAVPVGAAFGFCGNCTGVTFIDSNIAQDFAQGPPIAKNPFFGSGVQTITLTANDNYSGTPPTVSLAAPPPGGVQATATVLFKLSAVSVISGGSAFTVGQTFGVANATYYVTSTGGGGAITGVAVAAPGSQNIDLTATQTIGSPSGGLAATIGLTWNVATVQISQAGAGYVVAPAATFSRGAATATTTLGAPSAGNPTVPTFIDQRFGELGPVSNPQQFDFSQPGSYYNFNTTNPIQPDNAIEGSLVSGQLNTIQAAVPQPQGLIILSDRQAWLMNGGSPGSGISATQIVANSQAYNGCASQPPPIVANDNILYVQSKGSIVRDLVFNFYTSVYTGTDISVLSSHLFYGFSILEWAWAEEPFKLVWAVRNDGTMLILTFLKEQELIAWSHSTTNGIFKSVATISESTLSGVVDAIYTVVQRTVNGNTVQYVERVTELFYPNGVADAWAVDAGLQYNGVSALSFQGAQHLAGLSVTGLATDNLGNVTVITPFTMPINQTGIFTLPAPTPIGSTGYTRVTLGLAYTPAIQTLELDTGEPTIQGKRKKITGVTLKVKDALGLWMGTDSTTIKPIRDLVLGNVGSAINEVVTGLVTGDVRGILDPLWSVQGQYYITQPFPYPASVLGVIPEINIGDTPK